MWPPWFIYDTPVNDALNNIFNEEIECQVLDEVKGCAL